MNIARTLNCIIAAALIAIYLVLPATALAKSGTMEGGVPSVQTVSAMTTSSPCNDCPCSDEKDSSCCDSAFCCCACHAPLSQGFQLAYAPVVAIQGFREPAWSLPQVFLSIFVPPQNLS
jgi:hypothetical protein